jgi:NAD-specific glutamate dehydrogenase
LYTEGQKLESDLNSRNSDINRLLSKIDSLTLNDQAKSAKCNLFVNELQADHRKLLSQVEKAKLATRQDVDALIESNRDLLSTSKETYSKLQSVVSTCLSKVLYT